MGKREFPIGWIVGLGLSGLVMYKVLRKPKRGNEGNTSLDRIPPPGSQIDGDPGFFLPSPPLAPPCPRPSGLPSAQSDSQPPSMSPPTPIDHSGGVGKSGPLWIDVRNPWVDRLLKSPAGRQVALDLSNSAPFPLTPPPLPLDQPLATVARHPCVILILGHRGAGKSALACRLQELLRDRGAPYAIALPSKAIRLLPSWYGLADDAADIPPNAVIYIPESYRLFHARSALSAQGRAIRDLVNLCRHRRQTIIFDVQNPAHLDRNIISEADVILVKEPGPFTQGFERPQLRGIMDSARAAFSALSSARKKRAVWVVSPGVDVAGQLMENRLPSFWTDALSRIFGDCTVMSGTVVVNSKLRITQPVDDSISLRLTASSRRGQRTASGDKRLRALHLHSLGHSYREIGDMIGVSKSQAFRLVNEKTNPRSTQM